MEGRLALDAVHQLIVSALQVKQHLSHLYLP